MAAFTYILVCADGTLYTGWTKDPARRLKEHNKGKGAKYTRSRLPVRMVYLEEYETDKEAQRREYDIKQKSRAEKINLLERKS